VADTIETTRLRLPTMGVDFLRASLARDNATAQGLCGLRLPEDWPDRPDILKMRLGQLEAHSEWEPWLTRLVGLRDEGLAVGITGFHGPPGGSWLKEFAPGGVEFGYTVYPAWQRRGIAFEASRALIAWATDTAEVRTFALSIQPQNEASVGLARKLGFSKVGTWEHEVRGTEYVYRLDVLG
jgi:ribosomal-protein-alanine N-acetyltransferase